MPYSFLFIAIKTMAIVRTWEYKPVGGPDVDEAEKEMSASIEGIRSLSGFSGLTSRPNGVMVAYREWRRRRFEACKGLTFSQ